jgi:hypothetical protein
MANEAEWSTAAEVTLEASGASVANAAFVQADDTTLAAANHSNYPLADFALKTIGFGAALASTGSLVVNLLRQPINFDTTAGDEPSPSASLRAHYVGSFVLPLSAASNSTYYAQLESVPLIPGEQQFWLENLLGQTINAGWTLKATPKTLVPGS